jgi:RNA polymerase sigma-70 factor (ECF subfamily)
MEAMTQAAGQDLTRAIESAAAGDEIAFGRIVAAYHDDMRLVCAFITHDHALAEDAVQTAWSIAWRKLGSLREPTRLRPWLVSVAANQARDLIRQRGRRSDVEFVADATRVAGGIDPATGVDSLDLLAALERLDPDDRALVAMRYMLGFDATELSTATGLSPSGTRTRLERLLARLRQDLDHG